MKNQEKKPENRPIFPIINDGVVYESGITLRDYLAAKAMQGMITAKLNDPTFSLGVDNENNNIISRVSYSIADAMLKEREK